MPNPRTSRSEVQLQGFGRLRLGRARPPKKVAASRRPRAKMRLARRVRANNLGSRAGALWVRGVRALLLLHQRRGCLSARRLQSYVVSPMTVVHERGRKCAYSPQKRALNRQRRTGSGTLEKQVVRSGQLRMRTRLALPRLGPLRSPHGGEPLWMQWHVTTRPGCFLR